jgi:hypothetical protein
MKPGQLVLDPGNRTDAAENRPQPSRNRR